MYCYTLHKINDTFYQLWSNSKFIRPTYLPGSHQSQALNYLGHHTSLVLWLKHLARTLKHNLSNILWQVKESTYLTMVRPQLEYASNAYHVEDIVELEKVQQRAACWVINDYGRYISVTSKLEQLSRPTLQFYRNYSHYTSHFTIKYHLQFLHTSYKHHVLRDSTTYYTTSYHSHLLQHISTAIFTEQWMIGINYQ